MLSLRMLCVYSTFGYHPHPQATLVPNFVSVAPLVAELACGEKSDIQSLTQSLTHPAYLICWEPELSLWNKSRDVVTVRKTS